MKSHLKRNLNAKLNHQYNSTETTYWENAENINGFEIWIVKDKLNSTGEMYYLVLTFRKVFKIWPLAHQVDNIICIYSQEMSRIRSCLNPQAIIQLVVYIFCIAIEESKCIFNYLGLSVKHIRDPNLSNIGLRLGWSLLAK